MIKNIIIVVLSIVTVFSLIFANLKSAEADKMRVEVIEQEEEAMRQAALAREAQFEAEKQMERALLEREEAEFQKQLAEKALADCKKGK